MARKKLPLELKAKNHTFKLYDWEVEKVKEYIKCVRANKQFYISTKSNNCIELTLEQYRELLSEYNKVLRDCFYRESK